MRSFSGLLRQPKVDRLSAAVGALWSIGVAAALWATLTSLRTSDFDGLNNILQFPFALPWLLIPIASPTT
jgi:hypothetical protein